MFNKVKGLKQMDKKVPTDVTIMCEQIVKGYERRRREYEKRRRDITYSDMISLRGDNLSSKGDLNKPERLRNLDESLNVRFLKAVEQSLLTVGTDVSLDISNKLRRAIMLNCENGREYPYELLDIDVFSKTEFYRRKKAFIKRVGENLELF